MPRLVVKSPGHLFGQYRKQRLFMALLDASAVDRRNAHRQVANVGSVAYARYDYAVDRVGASFVGEHRRFGRQGGPHRKNRQQGCDEEKFFHEL